VLHFEEFLHGAADLTLVPSVAIGRDLQAARVTAGLHNCTKLLIFDNKILGQN
jgi:hypothetical protein